MIHGTVTGQTSPYYVASITTPSTFSNATGTVIYICGSALGVIDCLEQDLHDAYRAMLEALRAPAKIRAAWWPPAIPPRRVELKPRRRFTRWCSGRGSARAARRNIRRRR